MPADPQRSVWYGRFLRDRRRDGSRRSKRIVRYAQTGSQAIDGTVDANNAATVVLAALWPTTSPSTVSGTITTTWTGWTATGAGTVKHPATVSTVWSTWAATGSGTVKHPATTVTTWSTWTATGTATVTHPATITTVWSTWTATAAGTTTTPTPPPPDSGGGGGIGTFSELPFVIRPYIPHRIAATSQTIWQPWTATAAATRIDDGEVLELLLIGAL